MLGDEFGRDGGGHARTAARTIEWKTARPSVEPISGSVARSGWGIMPMTLRSRLRMPAISRSGAVGVVEVAEDDAVLGFELVEGALVGVVAAFAVGDGDAEDLAALGVAGEGRVGGFDAQVDVAADEFQAAIAEQGAGEQAGFDQDLEAVADAEHEAAIGGELLDGLHDGREFGDGAAAQVIAVGEAAGEDDGIDVAEGGGVMPDELRLLPEVVGDGVECVVIAIAAGKDNDAKFHG